MDDTAAIDQQSRAHHGLAWRSQSCRQSSVARRQWFDGAHGHSRPAIRLTSLQWKPWLERAVCLVKFTGKAALPNGQRSNGGWERRGVFTVPVEEMGPPVVDQCRLPPLPAHKLPNLTGLGAHDRLRVIREASAAEKDGLRKELDRAMEGVAGCITLGLWSACGLQPKLMGGKREVWAAEQTTDPAAQGSRMTRRGFVGFGYTHMGGKGKERKRRWRGRKGPARDPRAMRNEAVAELRGGDIAGEPQVGAAGNDEADEERREDRVTVGCAECSEKDALEQPCRVCGRAPILTVPPVGGAFEVAPLPTLGPMEMPALTASTVTSPRETPRQGFRGRQGRGDGQAGEDRPGVSGKGGGDGVAEARGGSRAAEDRGRGQRSKPNTPRAARRVEGGEWGSSGRGRGARKGKKAGDGEWSAPARQRSSRKADDEDWGPMAASPRGQSPRSRRRVVRTNTTSTSDDTPVGEGSLEGGVERKMTDEELALLLHHELNATHVRRRTREQRGAGPPAPPSPTWDLPTPTRKRRVATVAEAEADSAEPRASKRQRSGSSQGKRSRRTSKKEASSDWRSAETPPEPEGQAGAETAAVDWIGTEAGQDDGKEGNNGGDEGGNEGRTGGEGHVAVAAVAEQTGEGIEMDDAHGAGSPRDVGDVEAHGTRGVDVGAPIETISMEVRDQGREERGEGRDEAAEDEGVSVGADREGPGEAETTPSAALGRGVGSQSDGDEEPAEVLGDGREPVDGVKVRREGDEGWREGGEDVHERMGPREVDAGDEGTDGGKDGALDGVRGVGDGSPRDSPSGAEEAGEAGDGAE